MVISFPHRMKLYGFDALILANFLLHFLFFFLLNLFGFLRILLIHG
jgi:hypothetical protein